MHNAFKIKIRLYDRNEDLFFYPDSSEHFYINHLNGRDLWCETESESLQIFDIIQFCPCILQQCSSKDKYGYDLYEGNIVIMKHLIIRND